MDDTNQPTVSGAGVHLLDRIRAIRAGVGDGLNDDELSRLLWQSALPNEAGFGFLSYGGGVVTLTVPPQNLENWYPPKGWIVADKQRVARAIAEKYHLSVCEPPDESPLFLLSTAGSLCVRHHLELSNEVETILIAHPHYLKIRLFGTPPGARYARGSQAPLLHSPELLRDLSALYEP